jgi:hypothetical protein
VMLASDQLSAAWQALIDPAGGDVATRVTALRTRTQTSTHEAQVTRPSWRDAALDACFAAPSVMAIIAALESAGSEWAQQTLHHLRHRSPLMLHVVLEQLRRGRAMDLADDLRMERDLVRHCFHTRHLQRHGASSETVEGIRALAVDKDHKPQWNPARIEEVTAEMVQPFFESPWPSAAHPLRDLE